MLLSEIYSLYLLRIVDGFEQVSIHDMDWTIPTAVIFGNEHLYVPSITQR